jgi:hypothetical protein
LIERRIFLSGEPKFSLGEKSGESGDKYINFGPVVLRAFYTSSPVEIVQLSITTQAPFPNFCTTFLMIKGSNVIAWVVAIKLTDVRT